MTLIHYNGDNKEKQSEKTNHDHEGLERKRY